jgi:hypothetical protein
MRRALAGAVAAVALMGGSARADVFVPDDPAPRDARCVAADGDVVVATRSDDRGWIVELSEAGGPWRRVAVSGDLPSCPRVAAAADGTAVIGLSTSVLVRSPGGAFGAPVALGMRATEVAAAPGGWAAAVGERMRKRHLVASILAPDGTTSSATLERARVDRRRFEGFLTPRIGLDARGAATVVWTRWEAISGTYVLRTSATADRSTWTAARSLGTGAEPKYNFPTLGQIDVAVAPGGHRLVAWADGRGVHASVDGGPAARLTAQRTAGSPTVSIADDGSALVAYGVRRARVLANDRGTDGLWAAARELAGDDLGPRSYGDRGTPHEVDLASVLAPDGRAVVAWDAGGFEGRRLVAAHGRVGGPWTPAAPVSLATRDAVASSLSLAASGEPRLMWVESVDRGPADRLRGARLVPEGAAPVDRTAPVLATRLPARTPRTRTGRVILRIPITCSEACDARVRLVDPDIGFPLESIVRELPAGVTTIVRLKTPGHVGREMLKSRRARRPRIEVLVTDRAGNLARSARRVRFRIVDRPLLSFLVGPKHDFLMYTRAGDRAVGRVVNSLIRALAAGEIGSFQELHRRYRRGERALVRAGHDDVFDTAARDEIFLALDVPLARKGYSAEALLGS